MARQDRTAQSHDSRPDLTIIIVSWHVRDDLVRCIHAILSEPVRGHLELEIIVVDNASTDGSLGALSNLPVRVIANGENVGYGRANNQGLAIAAGHYLMVLNPDTVPKAGSLSRLVGFTSSRPRAGIVAPRLLNADGSVQPSAFAFPTLAM